MKIEHAARPYIVSMLPPKIAIQIYSRGRREFLHRLDRERPEQYKLPDHLKRNLWGLQFGPLMNAAGMFKNCECYPMTALQGAGGYLAGTSEYFPWKGNEKNGVYLPFVPYPRSGSASNWLGLPTEGDHSNASKIERLVRISDTPVGQSVAEQPGNMYDNDKMKNLALGMWVYEMAGVDFIEVNDCPNVVEHADGMTRQEKLAYISEHFLKRRERKLPVIVKISPDIKPGSVSETMDMLFELGFDGVNFGNASKDYARHRESIHPTERSLYDYYTSTFTGAVSGKPLKEISLELAGRAAEYLRAGPPVQEFHVIRTGGIESAQDIVDSDRAGISLNEWLTGYWSAFVENGHDVYRLLYEEYDRIKKAA